MQSFDFSIMCHFFMISLGLSRHSLLRPYKRFRIDKDVVSDTEKRPAKIFGKEIRPKVFGKWTKKA